MNFDSYWAEAWKVSSGTGAMDNAFREVAEKGWRGGALAALDEAMKQVPDTWLDSLLTGDGAPEIPLHGPDIEALCKAITERISRLRDKDVDR